MKLPADTIIAPAKLTDYLLKPRPDHDKAGFLALAGYSLENAVRLEADIRGQLLTRDALPTNSTPYGDKVIIDGALTGPNGHTLRVRSVWMLEKATGLTKFITLYPAPT